MMPFQRARDAESRVRNKLSNGPRRVQSNAISQSILQRADIRQLSGVCWYPRKCTAQAVKQGGTADKFLFVLGRLRFCHGRFLFGGIIHGFADQTMALPIFYFLIIITFYIDGGIFYDSQRR